MFPKTYPHFPKTLGDRIRRRRMDLGLTQRNLAEKLGCWYQCVASWERGLSVPLSRRWPAIAAVLGSGLLPELEGLPDRVRSARLGLGLTQEALARRAGVHVRTVRNVEQGLFAPNQTTAARLRGVLGEVL